MPDQAKYTPVSRRRFLRLGLAGTAASLALLLTGCVEGAEENGEDEDDDDDDD